jgi:hypothetical protein
MEKIFFLQRKKFGRIDSWKKHKWIVTIFINLALINILTYKTSMHLCHEALKAIPCHLIIHSGKCLQLFTNGTSSHEAVEMHMTTK